MNFVEFKKEYEAYGSILGMQEEFYKLVSVRLTSVICALGRIDFTIDNNGDLKILGFNSETPAGLVEAMGLNSIVNEKLNIKYDNPNENLKNYRREAFSHILVEFKKQKNKECCSFSFVAL